MKLIAAIERKTGAIASNTGSSVIDCKGVSVLRFYFDVTVAAGDYFDAFIETQAFAEKWIELDKIMTIVSIGTYEHVFDVRGVDHFRINYRPSGGSFTVTVSYKGE